MNNKIRLTYTLAMLFALSAWLTACIKEGTDGHIILEGPVIARLDDVEGGRTVIGWARKLPIGSLSSIPHSVTDGCESLRLGTSGDGGSFFRGLSCR